MFIVISLITKHNPNANQEKKIHKEIWGVHIVGYYWTFTRVMKPGIVAHT